VLLAKVNWSRDLASLLIAKFALSERTVFIGSGDLVSSTAAFFSHLTAADITVSHLMTWVNRIDGF
jgi:hypothetical protein